jgi:hypothetical protein
MEFKQTVSNVANQSVPEGAIRMTLQQYLDARLRRMMWISLLSLVGTVALSLGLFLLKWPYWFVALPLFLVFIWRYNLSVSNACCPRCGSRLGRLAYAYLNTRTGRVSARRHYRKEVEALGGCPHCGLQLDEAS